MLDDRNDCTLTAEQLAALMKVDRNRFYLLAQCQSFPGSQQSQATPPGALGRRPVVWSLAAVLAWLDVERPDLAACVRESTEAGR